MAHTHPLRSFANQLASLAGEIDSCNQSDGPFALCVTASATRSLQLLHQLDAQWEDPVVGLLLPCLRPACEDLIALTYLHQFPDDRDAILDALNVRI